MTYPLTVEYKRSIEQLVKAGKYDYANSDITTANFKNEDVFDSKSEAILFHPDEAIESDEILTRFEKEDLRPATLRELLAFGAKYPNVQCEFPIIALGTVVRLDGDQLVAYLGRDDARRGLHLGWFDGGWSQRCRFLAFRKHGPKDSSSEPSRTLEPLILEIVGQRYEIQATKLP
jgi:hypothetical protein